MSEWHSEEQGGTLAVGWHGKEWFLGSTTAADSFHDCTPSLSNPKPMGLSSFPSWDRRPACGRREVSHGGLTYLRPIIICPVSCSEMISLSFLLPHMAGARTHSVYARHSQMVNAMVVIKCDDNELVMVS